MQIVSILIDSMENVIATTAKDRTTRTCLCSHVVASKINRGISETRAKVTEQRWCVLKITSEDVTTSHCCTESVRLRKCHFVSFICFAQSNTITSTLSL